MNDIWRRGICCGGGEEGHTAVGTTRPRLKAAKHQFFQSHPSYLPKVALLAIHFQPALAFVAEGRGYLKHRIALVIPHQDRVVGEAEYHGLLQLLSLQENRKFAVILLHGKLVGRIAGAQAIAGLNVRFNLRSEGGENLRKGAGGSFGYPVEP